MARRRPRQPWQLERPWKKRPLERRLPELLRLERRVCRLAVVLVGARLLWLLRLSGVHVPVHLLRRVSGLLWLPVFDLLRSHRHLRRTAGDGSAGASAAQGAVLLSRFRLLPGCPRVPARLAAACA